MIRLAVIGDIGSGKSYVAKQFGYPIFNADTEVAELYKKNKKCYTKLKKALPYYITSFPIKKKQLSKAVVDNPNNIKKINKTIHPEISKKFNNFIKKNKKKKLIILDIPLFLENKMNKKNDIVIFVSANKKDIDKRLTRRNETSQKIVKKLKKFQLPLEVKKEKSNFIIKNNFRNNSVKKNVKRTIGKILLNA